MYARSVGNSRQRASRSVHITTPRQQTPLPPPDYSGTALPLPSKREESFEAMFQDGSREEIRQEEQEVLAIPQEGERGEETRYPLYEDRQDERGESSPALPWITHRKDNDRRYGAKGLGGLLPVPLEMDDMLLVSLLILLLANGSDEETILILAFLLLAK